MSVVMAPIAPDPDFDWGIEAHARPQLCPATRGLLACTGWANHAFGHTFTATSQPQRADHDTEARQEDQR